MCCGKKSAPIRPPGGDKIKTPARAAFVMPDENPEAGCYLYIWEGVCYMEWALATPDYTNLLFARPTKRVPRGKFTSTALYEATTEDPFLDSVIAYLKEVSPYLPEVTMMSDANDNSLGFLVALHQPGNNVIGDRAVRLNPGRGSVYIEGSDCVGVTLASADMQVKSPQPLKDFIDQHKEYEGRLLRVDPDGKFPPALLSD